MTKLSYTVTTNYGKAIKVNTYAEMLKVKGENPGCKVTTEYEPIPEEKAPISAKKAAARVKATI